MAIGWVVNLSLFALAKIDGRVTHEDFILPNPLHIPGLFLCGYLVRLAARPMLRRISTWLDEPVSKNTDKKNAIKTGEQ